MFIILGEKHIIDHINLDYNLYGTIYPALCEA